jgi:hypothetical protein
VCELLDAVRRLADAAQQRHATLRANGDRPVTIVRPRQRARLALAPGVLLGFRVEARSAAGRPPASAVVAIHVALAPAALTRARPSTLIEGVLPLAAAAALRESGASLAEDLHAHQRYIERATVREAALRAAVSGTHGCAAGGRVQVGLFDRRAVQQATQQREAREQRRELHTVRLAQLALGGHVDERLSAEPVLALVLR